MSGMFKGCSGVGATLDLSNFDTSNVTNMGGMFSGCSNLPNLDLSSFDTSNVTDMSYMFEGCTGFDRITFGENFNTSNVTNMSYMFNGCENLQEITFSVNFNTSNVKNMSSMFKGCQSLESENFDLSSFDTSNVTDMSSMFEGVSNPYFSSLDLSSFNTSKVKNMNKMFDGCGGIHNLTIDNFDMSSVDVENNGALYMFACETLYTLTMKSLPYLVDGTFNSQFSGTKEVDWEEVPVVVNVELDDNSVVYTGQYNYLPAATSASYTRTMPTDAEGNPRRWGSAVLPFAVNPDEQTGVKPYEFSGVSSYSEVGELTLKAATETVAAGHPFLFKNTAGAATVTFTKTAAEGMTFTLSSVIDGDVFNFVDDDANIVSIQPEGTYKETKIGTTDDEYYFVAQDTFWYAEVATTVKPFRAWFGIYFDNQNSAPARSFNIVEGDGDTQGITTVSSEETGDKSRFDLQGRRLGNTLTGLVIENGRVIMMK